MIQIRVSRRSLLLGACAVAFNVQAFPERTVRLVVPFAAGGGTDTWARQFATRLSAQLGQPVIVDNRPGASTQLGSQLVARAEPDGYTLLFTSGTHIQVPALSPNLTYDVVRDFAPIGQLGTTGLVFVVHPGVKATNMREFIAEAKASSTWSLGTYASGSTGDVFSRAIAKDYELNLPVAAYKGEAPAIADVVGGQIQGGFFSVPSVKALVKGGRLKALGSLAVGEIPAMPEVKTLPEQGFERYSWPGIWLGLFAPAKTPPAVLERLGAATLAVTGEADFRREWAERDVSVQWRDPARFSQDIRADMKTWGDLINTLGLKPQ